MTDTISNSVHADTRFSFESKPHGEGGFGRVIKGRDKYLERDIAVKVLNPLFTEFSEPERERFKREARIREPLTSEHSCHL
jgi:serine/threonine protein kinase